MSQVRYRLEDLLARLPGGDTDSNLDAAPSDATALSPLAQQTLAKIQRVASKEMRPDFDSSDVLRTPLPLEPGEPTSLDAPQGDSTGAKVSGFDDVFEPDAEAFDPLRAPQKSGEHAPIRIPREPKHLDLTALTGAPPQRPIPFWVWGGAVTLAAAAAWFLVVRPSAGSRATDPLAPEGASNRDVIAMNQPPEERAPMASKPPAGAGAPMERLPTGGTPADGAQKPVLAADLELSNESPGSALAVNSPPGATKTGLPAVAGARKPTRAPSAPGAVPEPKAETDVPAEEPALVPAAGPSNLPDYPSTGAISAALARPLGSARRCLPPNAAPIAAHLTFASSGKVSHVRLNDPNATPAIRGCITAALSGAQVAPFARLSYETGLHGVIPLIESKSRASTCPENACKARGTTPK